MKKLLTTTSNYLEIARKKIENLLGDNILVSLGENQTESVECIDTGSYLLNQAIGTNGYPKGRIIELYGGESCGKTTLALTAISKAQSNGINAAYIDVEHALDKEYAKKLKVDLNSLLIAQPNSGEEAFQVIELLLKDKLANLIIVDSVAALVPQAEVSGDITEQTMGLQARLMGKALRKLTPLIARASACVIFINQVREKVGSFYGPSEITPGGRALKFFSSLRIEIKKDEKILEENKLIGHKIKIKIVKNKLSTPFNQAMINYYFDKGINNNEEIILMALEKNLLEKKGSYYYFENNNIAQGWSNLKMYVENNPQILETLKTHLAIYS